MAGTKRTDELAVGDFIRVRVTAEPPLLPAGKITTPRRRPDGGVLMTIRVVDRTGRWARLSASAAAGERVEMASPAQADELAAALESARWTGEQRAPRAGEWYLSGAIIAAYRARADMTAVYPIAELVRGRSVTQWLPDELG